MKRRQFLQSLGLVGLGVILCPLKVLAKLVKYPRFNPNAQYGDWIYLMGRKNDGPTEREGRQFLERGMCEVIPPQYRDRVRWIHKVSGDGGTGNPFEDQRPTLGWKYTPKNYKPNWHFTYVIPKEQ